MKKIWTVFFLASWLTSMAQIDLTPAQVEHYFPRDVLVGDWVAGENVIYRFERREDGRIEWRKQGDEAWLALDQVDVNAYSSQVEKGRRMKLNVFSADELNIRVYDRDGELIEKAIWSRKIELGPAPSENPSGYFALYYPNLNTPYALYLGLLNGKWNPYLGIRLSRFTLYKEEGGPYESMGQTLTLPGAANALSKDQAAAGQFSMTLGLTHQVWKEWLHLHGGIGYGRYRQYRGFDLFTLDQDGFGAYEKSVWANDLDAEIKGLQLEAGVLVDLGFVLSLGVGVLDFQRVDVQFGIGYSF